MILGIRGMLGDAVHRHCINSKINIVSNKYKFDSIDFKNEVENFDGDAIINCIGAIPQKTNNFAVNYELPEFLSSISTKIIYPDTDCVFSGQKIGPYEKYEKYDAVDEYGKSKIKALDLIGNKTKIIRSCIVGIDKDNKSLLSWFLNSTQEVEGYMNHYMNCITSYQWAKIALLILDKWDSYDKITQIGSQCISKYSFLNTAKDVYNKNINIVPKQHHKFQEKCLESDFVLPPILTQLRELRELYENSFS